MKWNEKLYALKGKFGVYKLSAMLEITPVTFKKKFDDPGRWKMSEIDNIIRLYEKTFPE